MPQKRSGYSRHSFSIDSFPFIHTLSLKANHREQVKMLKMDCFMIVVLAMLITSSISDVDFTHRHVKVDFYIEMVEK